MSPPTKLYVGWDVGGWHCDRNASSRDALVVTALIDGEVTIVGRHWRGNLRALLMQHTGYELATGMLKLCGLSLSEKTEIVIAIDTPLGWPSAMMCLAQGGATSFVSASDGENPYTRRETELELIRRGFTPLSAVRDMLGSQSTKGIHFLRAAGLEEDTCGLWRRKSGGGGYVTAMETYPAVALQADRIRSLQAAVIGRSGAGLQDKGKPMHDDIRDALACSLVAYMFAERSTEIDPIPAHVPSGEGWIVLPMQ